VCDPEAIDVDLKAGEGKEVKVKGRNGRMLKKNAFFLTVRSRGP
jgi:hypothetical protein